MTRPPIDEDVAWNEPWEARAVALSRVTVQRLDLPWEAFQRRLIAVIDEYPDAPYYTSWLVALERIVIEHGGVEADELMTQRMRAASYRIDDSGHDDLEVFPIATDEPTLQGVLAEVAPEHDGSDLVARCRHAELQRRWIDGAPRAWMFRMYDGGGAQLLQAEVRDVEHWDRLRQRYLGLPPDPLDRSEDAPPA